MIQIKSDITRYAIAMKEKQYFPFIWNGFLSPGQNQLSKMDYHARIEVVLFIGRFNTFMAKKVIICNNISGRGA